MGGDEERASERLRRLRIEGFRFLRRFVWRQHSAWPICSGMVRVMPLTVLVIPGGRERTREKRAALFARSGFDLAQITPSVLGPCVIEGVPV